MRRLVRRLRRSRSVVWLLTMKNTYFPIPIARVGNRLYHGRKIVQAESRPWRDSISHDWTLYRQIDEPASILLETLREVSVKDDRVLDICCNVGRHLNYLAKNGYTRLTGFDVMASAIRQAPFEFPLLERANLVCANVTEFFDSCDDGAFEWAVTHSATLELIHPSFRVENEIFRTVTKGAVLLLNPKGHKYPRRFDIRLASAGFDLESVTRVGSSFDLFVVRKPVLNRP